MWGSFELDLERECARRLAESDRNLARLRRENERRVRRSVGTPLLLPLLRPSVWSHGEFNPHHVRSHNEAVSRAIEKAMRSFTYSPLPPRTLLVTKATGGYRTISMFPIADELVSRKLFEALMQKNRSRLSSRSFAYRRDIGEQDAVRRLRAAVSERQRIFVCSYDLRSYFDAVDHGFIRSSIDQLELSLTRLERHLIDAFLEAPLPVEVGSATTPTLRKRGIPQGTSISLALANIATGVLDRKLEQLPVDFIRYADDLLVWSATYDGASRAAEEVLAWAKAARVEINGQKSTGVRLLQAEGQPPGEIRTVEEVAFLGHAFGIDWVGMTPSSVDHIKDRVSKMIYDNLLREPLNGTQDFSRISLNDRDYVAYVWQLRRYLYGANSESAIRRMLHGRIPKRRYTGAVCRYPYVTSNEQIRELDEWIQHTTARALAKRAKILAPLLGLRPDPKPWSWTIPQLLESKTVSARSGAPVDIRLPTCEKMHAVVQRAVAAHGSSVVETYGELYSSS
jgi:RNA-directed DNA polymerase